MGKQASGCQGSELHRLKEFDHVDQRRFNKMYKLCLPLIRKLVWGIDCARYNVTRDIIQSYFVDKFMYVYNKYQDEYDDERLKATLLSSLKTYKYKFLRSAYTEKAAFNQDLMSFEEVYESGKEWDDEMDEVEYKEDLSIRFNQFMIDHLTPDEYLLFRTQLEPPKWFEEKMIHSGGRISILSLIDFFGWPRTKRAADLMSTMRKNVEKAIAIAKVEFKR